jgi:23S rRNA pseudouridine1911/1915/1917 synthase
MTQPLVIRVPPDDEGRRLDLVVAQALSLSRSASAALIRSGHVLVDGRAAKPSHAVQAGSTILVTAPPPRPTTIEPEDIPLRIIHDEAEFCVVDKPAGMVTHPARGVWHGTLVNALLARFPDLPAINGVRRPGLVHRLDKDTSGLLVVAKTERALRVLGAAVGARRLRRAYDAVVWDVPTPPHGVIDAPLGRDPRNRLKFAVREDGRRAVTRYRVVEAFTQSQSPQARTAAPTHTAGALDAGARTAAADAAAGAQAQAPAAVFAALLRVELETGRTHQIRVHCAAIGHPIVGDATYGDPARVSRMPRQALHAAELEFRHPDTGKLLHFTSPWPEDFRLLVERLRAGGAP